MRKDQYCFFVLFFLSSITLPRDLIEQEWFRTVATYNPVSYLVEGLRSLIITGWDGEALALGFGFAIALALAGVIGTEALASAFPLNAAKPTEFGEAALNPAIGQTVEPHNSLCTWHR